MPPGDSADGVSHLKINHDVFDLLVYVFYGHQCRSSVKFPQMSNQGVREGSSVDDRMEHW